MFNNLVRKLMINLKPYLRDRFDELCKKGNRKIANCNIYQICCEFYYLIANGIDNGNQTSNFLTL